MKLSKLISMFVISIFISTAAFASNEDIKITIDGLNLQTDVAPKIINGRTLVPVRAIFEAIGGEVEWVSDSQTVIGSKGKNTMKLQLGNEKASINGKEFILDVPATSVKGRTLVPVRFVAESLGLGIYWDHDTRTVVIENSITAERNFRFDKEKGQITGYRYDGPKNVFIPETIEGVAVKAIDDFAFSHRNLLSVTIPKGITDIGQGAFYKNNIKELIIPEGITIIRNHAFSENDLTSVELPEGIISIERGAFHINKLTSVKIPKSLKDISDFAFGANVELIREM